MKRTIRIATRESALALWQAEYIKKQLITAHPEIEVQILGLTTAGDKWLETPLAKVGGKGLFVKELESALLNQQADIAVHSMKDVPVAFPHGLTLAVICEREDPRDVFIANRFKTIHELPSGATVGTSSLRRQCQLATLRPDLKMVSLRGNVLTRIKKLDAGQFDAIILAAAGVKRLDLSERITSFFNIDQFIPAVGQGAIGIECRADDTDTQQLLKPLQHDVTYICVTAERAFNKQLNGGCQVPIAIHAYLQGSIITLKGLVGDPDGSIQIRGSIHGDIKQANELGMQLAQQLLDHGADKILQRVYKEYGSHE